MNFLDRIFGRKQARTATAIAAEIESRKVALVDAKSRLASARQRRQDAKNSLDAAGMSDADLEATRVGNEIEVLEYAIQELEAAYAAQVDAEAREALRAEIGAHEKTGEALHQEIEATYDKLAAPLAEMLARLDAHRRNGDRLRVRSREHRDEFYPANIEAFRDGPPRYRATWPGADGGMMTGSPEDAPAGCVAWIDGVPIAKRDDVTIEVRPLAPLGSLIDAVQLPGLRRNDAPLWPPAG